MTQPVKLRLPALYEIKENFKIKNKTTGCKTAGRFL